MQANELRLVAIGRHGEPQEELGVLPEEARAVCASTAELYTRRGFVWPWIGYLALVDELVVGTCAFCAPLSNGEVELAYFTFPAHVGRGIATRMARELLAIARSAAPEALVIAHTLAEENASTAILRKLGFELAGVIEHPEDGAVWLWRRPASQR